MNNYLLQRSTQDDADAMVGKTYIPADEPNAYQWTVVGAVPADPDYFDVVGEDAGPRVECKLERVGRGGRIRRMTRWLLPDAVR